MYASQFLTSWPQSWWNNRVHETNSPSAGFFCWSDFESALRAPLDHPFPAERARSQLKELRQTGSVTSYARCFNDLVVKIPHRDKDDILSDFIAGMKPNLQAYVKQTQPTTLDAARKLAIIGEGLEQPSTTSNSSYSRHFSTPMDIGSLGTMLTKAVQSALYNLPRRSSHSGSASSYGSRASRSPSPNHRRHNRAPSPHPRPRTSRVTTLTAEEKAHLDATHGCYFCKKEHTDHMARDCPDNPNRRRRRSNSPGSRHPAAK